MVLLKRTWCDCVPNVNNAILHHRNSPEYAKSRKHCCSTAEAVFIKSRFPPPDTHSHSRKSNATLSADCSRYQFVCATWANRFSRSHRFGAVIIDARESGTFMSYCKTRMAWQCRIVRTERSVIWLTTDGHFLYNIRTEWANFVWLGQCPLRLRMQSTKSESDVVRVIDIANRADNCSSKVSVPDL